MIINQVKALTGQTLVMDGKLSWTLFPVFGIGTGHLALANPPGFSGKYSIEIQRAKLSVHVLPLLAGRIETGQIILQGLTVHLQKNASGQTNWSFVAKSAQPAASSAQTPSLPKKAETAGQTKKTFILPAIAGMEIQNATFIYTDQMSHQEIRLLDASLYLGDMRHAGQPVPLKMKMDYAVSPQGLQGRVQLDGQACLINQHRR